MAKVMSSSIYRIQLFNFDIFGGFRAGKVLTCLLIPWGPNLCDPPMDTITIYCRIGTFREPDVRGSWYLPSARSVPPRTGGMTVTGSI